MKKAHKVNKKPEKHRHIEDVPFYLYKYGPDDLPLDPAKPFVLQKIRKFFQTFRYMSNCRPTQRQVSN